MPFAARNASGDVIRVIKPLHLAQADPIRIFDHGTQWAGRLRLLRDKMSHAPHVLLAVDAPQEAGDRRDAYLAVAKELKGMDVSIAPAANNAPILRFARAS